MARRNSRSDAPKGKHAASRKPVPSSAPSAPAGDVEPPLVEAAASGEALVDAEVRPVAEPILASAGGGQGDVAPDLSPALPAGGDAAALPMAASQPVSPAALEVQQLEVALGLREKALRAFEMSLAAQLAELEPRQAALQGLEQALSARERVVAEREDEVSIREAAVDEAMSLGQVFAPEAPAAPAGAASPSQAQAERAAGDLLEGPAEGADALLEGPGQVLEMPPVAVAASIAQSAEEARAAEQARLALQKKLTDEVEHLMRLISGLPFLHFVEPRVRKAQAESKVDVENALGFHNLALRLLREEYDKALVVCRRVEEAYKERDKDYTDLKEGYDQLRDDFERFRNRIKSDQEGMSARAGESLLHKIVPVVDNFDRALKASASASSVESLLSGVQMIARMFDDVLFQGGLVLIKAEPGMPFEPKTQEAVGVVETDVYPEDTIAEVVQRGYMLAGKVFRAAMVKVARPTSPGYRPVGTPLP